MKLVVFVFVRKKINMVDLHFTADFASPGVASQGALRLLPWASDFFYPVGPLTYIRDYLWFCSCQWFVFCSVLTEHPAATTVALLLGRPCHVPWLLLPSLYPLAPLHPGGGSAELPSVWDREKTLSYNSVYKLKVPA